MNDQQPQNQNNDSSEPSNEDANASIRRQALDALMPLIDSLEGTPEYKFEIIMNALQSEPNHHLLQKALHAAKQIEEPSAKAEALIDVINATDY